MSAKDETITLGLDHLNALFAWWGVPGGGDGKFDGQLKRLQAFTSDLQKTYGEVYGQQMQALLTTNERVAASLQELLRCRQPQELIAAESEIMATLMEGASRQAKTWIDLTQKVEDCCASMVRETAADLRHHGREAAPAGGSGGLEQRTAKHTSRPSAHA